MSVVAGAGGALAAFIAGPLGPLGSVDPVTGPATRPSPLGNAGLEEAVPSRSIGDTLSSLNGHGDSEGPVWLVLLIAIMFSASAGALAREVRRSV
jgi:hypothetical protein